MKEARLEMLLGLKDKDTAVIANLHSGESFINDYIIVVAHFFLFLLPLQLLACVIVTIFFIIPSYSKITKNGIFVFRNSGQDGLEIFCGVSFEWD